MARAWLRVQFTFDHPDDAAKYGPGPHVYEEIQLASLPGRELASLEQQFGEPIPEIMNGFRDNRSMADLAVIWWALRNAGQDVPEWAAFDVHTMLVSWEPVPAGKAPEAAEPSQAPEPSQEAAPMITLPSLPKAE